MAIANLQETWRTYTLRKNALSVEISNLQAQRTLATYQQGDSQSIKAQEEQEIREKYKALFNGDEEAFKADGIKRYDDIPDFEEEMNKLTAKYNDEMAELTAWETVLENQITIDSAELEEINVYMESVKSMLSSNIQEDFSYGSVGG